MRYFMGHHCPEISKPRNVLESGYLYLGIFGSMEFFYSSSGLFLAPPWNTAARKRIARQSAALTFKVTSLRDVDCGWVMGMIGQA